MALQEALSMQCYMSIQLKPGDLYLHVEEAKALAIQQQSEDNEGQRDIGAQNAQGRNADKVPEEGLLAH